MELLLLIAIGAASGLAAGLAGIAGGVVIVPALTWLYGTAALQAAVVISWFLVFGNSLLAARTQLRARAHADQIRLIRLSRWYIAGAVCVVPVVAIYTSTHSGLVGPVFVAILQLVLATIMLLPIQERAAASHAPWPIRDGAAGGLVGALSTLLGVGGGAYTTAYFVHAVGIGVREALVAANLTGLAIGFLCALGFAVSVIGFDATIPNNPFSWLGMLALFAGGMAAAPLGARWSGRLNVRQIRSLIIAALVLSALRLLITAA